MGRELSVVQTFQFPIYNKHIKVKKKVGKKTITQNYHKKEVEYTEVDVLAFLK
jgi:hypothetical protein